MSECTGGHQWGDIQRMSWRHSLQECEVCGEERVVPTPTDQQEEPDYSAYVEVDDE